MCYNLPMSYIVQLYSKKRLVAHMWIVDALSIRCSSSQSPTAVDWEQNTPRNHLGLAHDRILGSPAVGHEIDGATSEVNYSFIKSVVPDTKTTNVAAETPTHDTTHSGSSYSPPPLSRDSGRAPPPELTQSLTRTQLKPQPDASTEL
jgi:hypothetical protein